MPQITAVDLLQKIKQLESIHTYAKSMGTIYYPKRELEADGFELPPKALTEQVALSEGYKSKKSDLNNLLKDKEKMSSLIQDKPELTQYIDDSLKKDEAFMRGLALSQPASIPYFPKDLGDKVIPPKNNCC